MEAKALPRLELDPTKGQFHPSNLIRSSVNGLLFLEEFKMARVPEPGPSPRIIRRQEKATQRQAEHEEWRSDVISLIAAQSRAGEDPKRFQAPYLKELKDYHVKRAAKLGSHITSLEVEKPKLIKVRRWFAEKKLTYHRKRARVAAGKFIDFALSEATL